MCLKNKMILDAMRKYNLKEYQVAEILGTRPENLRKKMNRTIPVCTQHNMVCEIAKAMKGGI